MDRNDIINTTVTRSNPRKQRPTKDISQYMASQTKNNLHLISSDSRLSKIFKQKTSVTYRKNKFFSDHLLKSDIANQQPCGKCKLCLQTNTVKLITNNKLNITEKIKGAGNCWEREIIYPSQCSKLKVLYIGNTGEQLSERFSKHRYDIKNRPDNSELAKHFHESHNLNNDLNVTILQNNIKTAAARRYHEDKWICKLKTLAPHGLNTEIGDYAKEMYNFY